MTDETRHPTEETTASASGDRARAPNSDGRPQSERLPLKRVAKVAGTLCLLALLAPFLVFAVPQTVGADHGFVILSGSMEPELSPGDVVIVSDAASVGVGDVITFSDGSAVPITHRVVGVVDGQFVTKGDANENADSAPVDPSAVLGRVVITIPVLGHVILWANTPLGQVSLVVVPLVLLGVSSLYGWAREEPEAAPDHEDEQRPPPDDASAQSATDIAAMFERLDDEPATAAPTTGPRVAVADPDLKLTLLATAVVCGYAAWNVTREVAAVGAPHPASVAVLTAGLLGVLFAAWATVSVRREPTADPADATAPPVTDGGEASPARRLSTEPRSDGGESNTARRASAELRSDVGVDPEADR